MDKVTIPEKALEAATRKIAKMRGCDKAVFSKCISAIEAGVPCKCEEEALAAARAMLAAWPMAEMPHVENAPAFIILPIPQPAEQEKRA